MAEPERTTHVSILVPHGSALVNSVVGLFKIFDLANHHSAEARGAAFALHLIASASTADLYGGHFEVKPDLSLSEVAATDVVIIPAMAGNLAEAIKNNPAFIPWIQKQYRAGSEIAGLCTGALFIAETGLIHEKHCSSHWFVDATFRKQYSQIDSLAEKTAAVAGGTIHSEGGAWLFVQKLLERVAGKRAALACSANFQDPFNRECQSVLSVSDPQQRHAKRIANKKRSAVGDSMQPMTAERFISRFERNHGDREGILSIATLLEESLRSPAGNSDPKASRNPRALKGLLKKIERRETSYCNGQA